MLELVRVNYFLDFEKKNFSVFAERRILFAKYASIGQQMAVLSFKDTNLVFSKIFKAVVKNMLVIISFDK